MKQTTGTEAPPGDISVAAAEGLSSITDLISSISQDYGHDSAQADRSGTYPVEAQTESQDRPDDKTVKYYYIASLTEWASFPDPTIYNK